MKKTIAIILALMLGIAMLAGCGGDDGSTTAAPDPAPAQSPSPSPQQTPPPPPPPPPPRVPMLYLESEDFGNMGLDYPENAGITVEIAPSDEEDLSEFRLDTIHRQRAYLRGDGFTMVLGYLTLHEHNPRLIESTRVSFEAAKAANLGIFNEVNFGGNDGWRQDKSDYLTLHFPATTMYGSRSIAIVTEESRPNLNELLNNPQVQEILETLELTGDFKVEAGPDAEPRTHRFVTYSAVGGWEHINFYENFTTLATRDASVAMNPNSTRFGDRVGEMQISDSGQSPRDLYNGNSAGEPADNVTINGIEYLVKVQESQNRIWMYASRGGTTLNENEPGTMMVQLHNSTIEGARPVLETFVPR